jgi:hypothetical protein
LRPLKTHWDSNCRNDADILIAKDFDPSRVFTREFGRRGCWLRRPRFVSIGFKRDN